MLKISAKKLQFFIGAFPDLAMVELHHLVVHTEMRGRKVWPGIGIFLLGGFRMVWLGIGMFLPASKGIYFVNI